MEDGIHTRERYREFTEGNVIRATQIMGEEKQRGGFRYHLADSTQCNSKAPYTGKNGAYVAIVKVSSDHFKHTGHYFNLPCYFHVNRSLDQVRYSSGGFSENKIHSSCSLQES